MKRRDEFDADIFLANLRHEAGELPQPLTMTAIIRLLRLKGEEFIHQTYLTLLHRHPDEVGMKANLRRAAHYPGRLKIIVILLVSRERRDIIRRNRRF